MSMRTPMRTVRGLGSAKSGTEHFWRQRLTGAANAVLGIAFVIIVACLFGRSYEEARALIASPLVAVILVLLMISVSIHMRLGMQVVIEDYVHGEGAKIIALAANTFFAVLVGVATVIAILKIAFGG